MITPEQLRAARALIGWSQATLAEKSGVGIATIKNFELGDRDTRQGTAEKWRVALEQAGIEFIAGGVRKI
jgi:transcriptional regulator with XRE-family HTH domain